MEVGGEGEKLREELRKERKIVMRIGKRGDNGEGRVEK